MKITGVDNRQYATNNQSPNFGVNITKTAENAINSAMAEKIKSGGAKLEPVAQVVKNMLDRIKTISAKLTLSASGNKDGTLVKLTGNNKNSAPQLQIKTGIYAPDDIEVRITTFLNKVIDFAEKTIKKAKPRSKASNAGAFAHKTHDMTDMALACSTKWHKPKRGLALTGMETALEEEKAITEALTRGDISLDDLKKMS